MRVYCNASNSGKVFRRDLHFKGKPLLAPEISIRDYHDALKAWENLRFAKYLDVHDDKINPAYKEIRKKNYSFLDKLFSYSDKASFIEKYCDFTKFPNLRQISDNMHNTFINCVNKISNNFYSRYGNSGYEVLDAGYDPTCSLGLKKAFPGSDLDKGYVILKGNEYDSRNECIVNDFKGKLWEELDQRIVSLNHPDTAIDVYTEKQIVDKINWLDDIIKKDTESLRNYFTVITGVLTFPIWFPIACYQISKEKDDDLTDPYKAAWFNRDLAKLIKTPRERENAKNFAFFIEAVRENLKSTKDFTKTAPLFDRLKSSSFVSRSNVTQIPAWQKKISGGYLKNKLKNRMNLEKEFYTMSTEEKYELIKDIIKYSSNDQSYKVVKYFQNDDDIAGRYEELLEALK